MLCERLSISHAVLSQKLIAQEKSMSDLLYLASSQKYGSCGFSRVISLLLWISSLLSSLTPVLIEQRFYCYVYNQNIQDPS